MIMTAALRPMIRGVRPRWLLALGGLLVSVLDIAVAIGLGADLSINGHDIRVFVWLYLAVSFVAVGFLVGVLIEQRRRARIAERAIAEQMDRLSVLQTRLARAEKLSTLGQLAATIAHEIRNPLAVIRSSVQNVAEVADSDAKESCTFALQEIDRLNRVTGSMLDFSRPLKPERTRVEVADVFERVQLLARPLLAEKQLHLSTGKQALAADMDIDLVCQALIGLIANAAAVSAGGESVVLEAAREPDDRLALSVIDSGPGVPDDLLDRLFEPFFTTGKRGNGLGLAVVRDIARAHAGDVVVANRTDGGARFTLTLPMVAG